MEPFELADEIEARLRRIGTTKRAVGEKAYLKSNLEFVGATVWQTRDVVKAFLAERDRLTHDEVVALADALWQKPIHERRGAAIEVLEAHADLLGPGDLPFLERLIRDSRTWALVDELAGVLVAGMLVEHPEIGPALERWARDDDFWVRRSALLAHLRRLRAGGELGAFADHADAMLEEREFFIRKAIGWVLREAGKRRPAEVAAWLSPRTHRASGVTMREAVKYLPDDDRERLMTAYRERRPAG
jgi:3-methyladenine DNA glycosylase AlkD